MNAKTKTKTKPKKKTTATAPTVIAWHFVGKKLRDGRDVPADGEWVEHDGEIVMCKSGLRASLHPFDALQYAPGSTLCMVEVEGDIAHQADKLIARRRKIIRRIDAEPLMREFARWCALQVIELWDAPEVVRQYLTTGDESLRAAAARAAAAWDAARAAQKHRFQQMVNAAFGVEQ